MCGCQEQLEKAFWDAIMRSDNDTLCVAIAGIKCHKGASFDFINTIECPAIFLAVFSGNIRAVEMLVEIEGIDLDVKNTRSHDTPLHAAIKRNYEKIARILWDNGADPNIKNKQGLTAFALACKRQQFRIAIRMVRDLETDVDYCATDNDGNTCLHYFNKKIRTNYVELAKTQKSPAVLALRALLYYGLRGDVKNKKGERGLSVWPPKWELGPSTLKLFPKTFTDALPQMEQTLRQMKLPDEIVCQCIDNASALAWK
jgi:hypothetical protein